MCTPASHTADGQGDAEPLELKYSSRFGSLADALVLVEYRKVVWRHCSTRGLQPNQVCERQKAVCFEKCEEVRPNLGRTWTFKSDKVGYNHLLGLESIFSCANHALVPSEVISSDFRSFVFVFVFN